MSQLHHERLPALGLSRGAQGALVTLVEAAAKALGDDLAAVCVYGSAARGEWHDGRSDLNVLILLRTEELRRLEVLAAPLQAARHAARIAPFLLTADELQRAADVYCIKLGDIATHHVCLLGADLLTDLQIHPRDLRFVCEFELRNTALRLRAGFLQHHGQPADELATLLRLFSSTLIPLRALCGLLGTPAPRATPEALGLLERLLGADGGVLRRLWDLHTRGGSRTAVQLRQDHEELSAVVRAALGRLDDLGA